MGNFLENLMKGSKEIFSSHDSRYFLITALKFAIVPIISSILAFYSLWTIMEMNFNFFVANGFTQDNSVFYDIILMNLSEYAVYFSVMLIIVFMLGLFTSYLALRAFDHIEEHTFDLIEDIDSQLIINGLNKNKLIYQVSRIFFKYIQIFVKSEKAPKLKLPQQIENLKSPPLDKVFLFQYCVIVGIICLSTSMLLFSFTHELYQEIVTGGLELLSSNQIVSTYLDSQEGVLFNIYTISVLFNVLAYVFISRKIIKTVDGVSYGLARDMVKVIKGQHHIRLTHRSGDPGQGIAKIINAVLDDVFPIEEDNRSFDQAVNDTIEQLSSEYEPVFNSIDELNQEKLEEGKDYETMERSESSVLKMLMTGPPILPNEITKPIIKNSAQLPDQIMKDETNPKFQITTPAGVKLKNLDKDTVIELVKELEQVEKHKKTS